MEVYTHLGLEEGKVSTDEENNLHGEEEEVVFPLNSVDCDRVDILVIGDGDGLDKSVDGDTF